MIDLTIENDAVTEYVLQKPRWVSALAFPWFGAIIVLIVLITCIIQYPQTANARVQFATLDQAGKTATIEIDVAENSLYSIDTGQLVQLRLADYAYTRFGILEGRIRYIYGVTPNNNLKARIFLTKGFETNRHYHLEFKQGLKADGLIIIKNMNLIQRIFAGPVRLNR
jgi:hypothetical protein